MILHCYAYWKGIYTRDTEVLACEVNDLNNKFKEPMKVTEVNAILRCIPKAIERFINYEQGVRSGELKRVTKGMRDKDGYWYKNETLIERLEITEEEQKHMKTIIGVSSALCGFTTLRNVSIESTLIDTFLSSSKINTLRCPI